MFVLIGVILSYLWPVYFSCWDSAVWPYEDRNTTSITDNLTQTNWILPVTDAGGASGFESAHSLYDAQS